MKKRCPKCGIEKSLDEYYNPHGSYCIACAKEYGIKYCAERKEGLNQKRRINRTKKANDADRYWLRYRLDKEKSENI